MSKKLTFNKALKAKMRWIDVVQYLMPGKTEEEADFILWEMTCFPFDAKTTFKQLKTLAKNMEGETK